MTKIEEITIKCDCIGKPYHFVTIEKTEWNHVILSLTWQPVKLLQKLSHIWDVLFHQHVLTIAEIIIEKDVVEKLQSMINLIKTEEQSNERPHQ